MKKKITEEQFDRLLELWTRACDYEEKDPKVKGALYIFRADNPYAQQYNDYRTKLEALP